MTAAPLPVADVGIPDRVRRALGAAAGAPAPEPPRTGRPPTVALAGLTVREVAAAILGREATASESRAIGYALAGATDLGIARLHALLEARPELDARAVVADLAGRMATRRASADTKGS